MPSESSLGPWLTCRTSAGQAIVLVAPGVILVEEWDSDELFHWRKAVWDAEADFDAGLPPNEVIRLAGLDAALELVRDDAVSGHSVREWMIAATEEHADALAQLMAMQERQPGPGVADAVAELRAVVLRHREQAARCSLQPVDLLGVDRSPEELAAVAVVHPRSAFARLEQELARGPELTSFAEAARRLEREAGAEPLRDALIGLVYAKHQSRSWRYTRPLRDASREIRRAARRALAGKGEDGGPAAA
jgi:hypothetical protein